MKSLMRDMFAVGIVLEATTLAGMKCLQDKNLAHEKIRNKIMMKKNQELQNKLWKEYEETM